MTIICPQKKKNIKYFLITLFALVLVGGAFYIIQTGAIVEKRHELEALKKQLNELKTANADLKNKYYRIVDPAKLEEVASASGLTLEKRPMYITSTQ
ncbi:MAG: hypothetical protein WCO21_00350 [bacterium]|nr:hypothetical protein [Candidatus Jorgensenbacteria bacterium]